MSSNLGRQPDPKFDSEYRKEEVEHERHEIHERGQGVEDSEHNSIIF